MKLQNIIIITSILAITSCASKNKDIWVKNGVSSQGKEYTIADSLCTAESYKAAPEMPMASCGPQSGFSQGFCMSSQMSSAGNMAKVRAKVYDGCMLEKGWEKQLAQ